MNYSPHNPKRLRAEGGVVHGICLDPHSLAIVGHLQELYRREFGLKGSKTIIMRRALELLAGHTDKYLITSRTPFHLVNEEECLLKAARYREAPTLTATEDLPMTSQYPTWTSRQTA